MRLIPILAVFATLAIVALVEVDGQGQTVSNITLKNFPRPAGMTEDQYRTLLERVHGKQMTDDEQQTWWKSVAKWFKGVFGKYSLIIANYQQPIRYFFRFNH